MAKTLNVGMVGYGFMARAHSNAWANVSHFFDTGYRPVLKAVAARNTEKASGFAGMWGYERVENDWRKLVDAKDIEKLPGGPMALALQTTVNGKVTQSGNTKDMIFDVPFLIEYFSSFMTLSPGDLILTGTPDGVRPPLAMRRTTPAMS